MSLNYATPSLQYMRQYITEYIKARYPKSELTQEVFDDDTIREMYAEVNSKYVEWEYNEEE